MAKLLGLLVALLACGCANLPPPPIAEIDSPCAKHEASWGCQVERYGKVNAP